MPFPGLFDPEISKQGMFDPEINKTGVFDREYVSSPAFIGSVVNGTFLCVSLVFASFPSPACLPWSGSEDVIPVLPTITIDESEYLPGVTKLNWSSEALQFSIQGTPDELAILNIDESEFLAGPTKLSWINTAPQIAKGIEDEVTVITVDESEFLSGPTKSSWLNTSVRLASGIEDEIEVIVEDEGWLPPSPHSQWQSSVITDSNGDYVPAPSLNVDEDFWLPPVYQPVVSLQLLDSTSGPTSATVSVVDEFEWIPLSKYVTLWHPTIVSDPTDNVVPFVFTVEEEDSWLPTVRWPIINVQLLDSTSGPTSAVAPPIVDEEPQLIALVPPPVTYAITTWSYGAEDIGGSLTEEDFWQNLVKPVVPYLDARFVNRTDELVVPIQLIVTDDDVFKPAILPRQVFYRLPLWNDEQNDKITVVSTIDEEYWYINTASSCKFVLPKQWQFEQQEFVVFVPPIPPPPPICFSLPTGSTITIESPSGIVITTESPAQVVISSESPLVASITLEVPMGVTLSPESPTSIKCND